jgi:hypothetical protein
VDGREGSPGRGRPNLPLPKSRRADRNSQLPRSGSWEFLPSERDVGKDKPKAGSTNPTNPGRLKCCPYVNRSEGSVGLCCASGSLRPHAQIAHDKNMATDQNAPATRGGEGC